MDAHFSSVRRQTPSIIRICAVQLFFLPGFWNNSAGAANGYAGVDLRQPYNMRIKTEGRY